MSIDDPVEPTALFGHINYGRAYSGTYMCGRRGRGYPLSIAHGHLRGMAPGPGVGALRSSRSRPLAMAQTGPAAERPVRAR
jgi:hypothetical protein